MPLQHKKTLVLFTMVISISAILLLPSSFIPKLRRMTSNESHRQLNETSEKFKEYLEFEKESIISRLQEIDKSDADYLIYDCLPFSGLCGGWNDRITGVINTLMMSLIVNKKFRLIISTPCNTADYFAPNMVNWTVTTDILSNTNTSKQKFMDDMIYYLNVQNIRGHFQSKVNFIRNNWDVTDIFRVTQNIKDKIPWICNIHHADIYKIIFEILFRPTKSVLDPISRLSLDKSKKLVCAHVRMGTNPLDKKHKFAGGQRFPLNRTSILFDFLKKFDTNLNYIYIASDSPMLKDKMKKTFPGRFIDIPGEIILVDIDRGNGACEAYAKSLSEWWILTMCDVLVLTRSGFGMMAAYLRGNDKPLYCMDTDNMEIVPCTRYNILEHYPREMHALKHIPISRRNNLTHDYCPLGGLQLNKNVPLSIKKLIAMRERKV